MIDQPNPTPTFDGATFQQWRDGQRLHRQLAIVLGIMRDGQPHTLAELASVSARCRDLRKAKFGGHCIERSSDANGVWQYRMAQ